MQSELNLLGINYETFVEEDFQKTDPVLDQNEIEGLHDKYKEFLELVKELIAVYKKLQSPSNKNWREMSDLMKELAVSSHLYNFPQSAFQ